MKKRAPGKQKVLGILSGDTKRWFQVKELKNENRIEITLCYFKSQHEEEAKGWIYLKDVTELTDDGKTITIVSAARSITIEANSRAEHKFWLEGIAHLCPAADKSGLMSMFFIGVYQHCICINIYIGLFIRKCIFIHLLLFKIT